MTNTNGTALASETYEQRAVRMVLQDYRRSRRHGRKDPYMAACDVVDSYARYLADVVVDDGLYLELAKVLYQVARDVLAEVRLRADIGGSGRTFVDLTVTEQFWQTGRLAGATS